MRYVSYVGQHRYKHARTHVHMRGLTTVTCLRLSPRALTWLQTPTYIHIHTTFQHTFKPRQLPHILYFCLSAVCWVPLSH